MIEVYPSNDFLCHFGANSNRSDDDSVRFRQDVPVLVGTVVTIDAKNDSSTEADFEDQARKILFAPLYNHSKLPFVPPLDSQ